MCVGNLCTVCVGGTYTVCVAGTYTVCVGVHIECVCATCILSMVSICTVCVGGMSTVKCCLIKMISILKTQTSFS